MGHDVVTVQEGGRGGASVPDPLVFELANREDRAVLTFDWNDYYRLHVANPHHSGIVACTVDRDVHALALRIHEAIESLSSLHGLWVRIVKPQSK